MNDAGATQQGRTGGILSDPSAKHLTDGDLEAVFLPAHGMLGASLRHRDAEVLRRLDDLDTAAAKGSSAGIPLLHPWANRLAVARYRAAGRDVSFDPASPMLHLDSNGIAMHGVPWGLLAWEVAESAKNRLVARLDWSRPELLAVFPFRHRLEMTATLGGDGLTVETALVAAPDGPVPVSFGFHPYVGIPDLPRAQWHLRLPAMRRIVLDARGIPAGAPDEPFAAFDAPLAELALDDGFEVLDERPSFALSGAGRRVTVEFLSGYRFAQVFAPKGKDFVALEPMTAPTNALATGRGLTVVEAGARFSATFRIRVEDLR